MSKSLPFILLLLSGLAAGEEAIDLATAVQRAQADNPAMSVARQRIVEARAMLAQSAAAWHPMVGVEAGYSYMDYPLYTFGAVLNQEVFTPGIDFNDTPEADDLHVALTAGYQLYDGGRRAARRAAAEAGVEMASAGEEAMRRQLGLHAAQAWLQNYQAGQHAAAAEAMRDALAAHLETARDHRQQGTLVETDVLEVQVRLQEAEDQLLRIRNQQQLAAATLGNLLGREEPVTITSGLPSLPSPQGADGRPELRVAAAQVAAAEKGVAEQRAGHLPSLEAFGRLAYHDGFELEDGDGRVAWMAGLRLQVKLWDGQLTSNRIAAARSRVLAAEGQRRRTELQIDLQQTEARLGLDNAERRRAVAIEALRLAGQHVALTTARFEEGLATVTRLLDAEAARTAARIRLTNAEADVLLATISLRHAFGLAIVDQP